MAIPYLSEQKFRFDELNMQRGIGRGVDQEKIQPGCHHAERHTPRSSPEIEITVFVDVDIDILTDLPALEPVRVGIPEPVDE